MPRVNHSSQSINIIDVRITDGVTTRHFPTHGDAGVIQGNHIRFLGVTCGAACSETGEGQQIGPTTEPDDHEDLRHIWNVIVGQTLSLASLQFTSCSRKNNTEELVSGKTCVRT
jgi:hypothetical protein